MKRADILQTAEKCVCGKREQDYGKPENNFQAIADLWNAYLKHAYNSTPLPDFTAFDVAMLMALLKVGRIAPGTATDDSFVDACGYLACGGEIKWWGDQEDETDNMTVSALGTRIFPANSDRDPGSGTKQY